MSDLKTAAIEQALEALESKSGSTELEVRLAVVDATMILRAALAQPDPVATEQKNHTHEWIHTGAMKSGEYRCVQCGAWGKRNG